MRGASASYDDDGPPERMIPRGASARTFDKREIERVDLGVDLLLAHAARDELRVLRAEVEDQDEIARGPHCSTR